MLKKIFCILFILIKLNYLNKISKYTIMFSLPLQKFYQYYKFFLQKMFASYESQVLLQTPSTSPYSAIGLLKCQFDNCEIVSTGFLVSKKHVLTTAHSVCQKRKNDFVICKSILFHPALNGEKGYCLKGEKVFYPPQFSELYQNSDDRIYDWALVQLEHPVSDRYCIFRLGHKNAQKNGVAELTGYPFYILYKNGSRKRIRLTNQMNTEKVQYKITPQKEGLHVYRIGESAGQAGSPLFVKQNQNYYAIGVHRGTNRQGLNEGALLTNQRISHMKKWIEGRLQVSINISHSSINNNKFVELTSKYANCLKHLVLSNNQITQIPETIKKFKQLIQIDLSFNKIIKIPDEIWALNFVEYLNLSNNYITELSENIKNLLFLQFLLLSNNNLKSLPNSIGNLKNMDSIDISANPIKNLPENIINLSKKTKIIINNPYLSNTSKQLLKKLKAEGFTRVILLSD